MSQKSVTLSELVRDAVSDLNQTPPVNRFAVIAGVLRRIEASGKALRLQCIEKMNKYLNKIISVTEMYYVLCLIDYIVCNVPSFHRQILDIDFIGYFETIGEFKV